ncbi:MAG: AraC family transcriptional regulator [Gammaproteobacteria bacterium]|jgi:AraC-like DNA-binding protein|nr:AraC family transcriptional regulator [Gammaproteobacteria bacterium]NDB16316.1 AraC family transcriptional regulator [Gammaproteobacteria bacterium]NDB24746.1 AraC family transcriptional regulator [Gammaproteobacteria bacterium]NDE86954.1 AraC family transcriptional regulator [Gammaproteobacteria bacterium]
MMPDTASHPGTRAIELPEPSAEKLNVLPPHSGVLNAVAFVRDHFHEKFPARDIAAHCGLSRFQFSRSFHAVFGITFREYLLRYRIRAACERLITGDTPVTEIAFAVGFHDGSYFARMFRRYTGVLPSQYARAHAAQLRA